MLFRVLGPIEVGEIRLGGTKPRTLLAALLVEPRRVIPVNRLVDLVWDEEAPDSAVASVHTYVSALRRRLGHLGSVLVTKAPGYLLDVQPDDNDVEAFRDLVRLAKDAQSAGEHTTAMARFDQALALWRGTALDGITSRFAETYRAGLAELRLVAEEGRAHSALELGLADTLLPALTALSDRHPLRDGVRGLLMRALYHTGRQAEALSVYRQGRDQVVAQLGIEPGPDLRELHERILRGTVDTVPVAVRSPASRPPNQLPPDTADFTGRARELDLIMRLGRETGGTTTPVAVVSGIAGTGKSALAVHAAHLLRDAYPDGQLYADLRSASDAGLGDVLGRFLRALGTPGNELPSRLDERVELYRMAVADRRMIIVLDDAKAGHRLGDLVPAAPGCLVIVTSRRRLGSLPGATMIELDVLSPHASVEMLGRIAGAATVSGDRQAAEAVALLCGGIPLAIRIAACKLLERPHWRASTLVSRLSDEHRRLDELAAGDLAVRASLGVGYRELTGSQLRAFHLLAVLDLPDFGSWVVSPLAGVTADDAEEIVEGLADRRLVEVAGIDPLGRPRYRFHDLVRLFAAEHANRHETDAEVTAAVRRLLATWMALLDAGAKRLPQVTLRLAPALVHAGDVDAGLVDEVTRNPVEWLRSETVAVVRTVERAHQLGVDEMTTALAANLLSSPFSARNEFDGWERTHAVALAAARASGNSQAEAIVLVGLGQLSYERDDFDTAMRYLNQALGLADERIEMVALVGIGTVHRDRGQVADARAVLGRALLLAERIGEPSALAAAMYGLGCLDRDHGDLGSARELLGRCVESYRDLRDPRGEALAIRGLGLVHRASGELAESAALSRRAHDILVGSHDELGAAYARQSLAKTLIRQGDPEQANRILRDCLEVCSRQRDRFGIALVRRTIGEALLAAGSTVLAAEQLGAALRGWEQLDLPIWQARTLRDLAAATGSAAHWATATDLFRQTGAREAGELAGLSPADWLARVREA
nr:BTAD domain-containing putative transcriptional regulator [Kibdelosporangium sp. MJ126-NF4]CTQ90376.1 putative regulatory protein [Kibdelosporangium sp. MJ126-NF4]